MDKLRWKKFRKLVEDFNNQFKIKLQLSLEFHEIIEEEIARCLKSPIIDETEFLFLKEDWKLNYIKQLNFANSIKSGQPLLYERNHIVEYQQIAEEEFQEFLINIGVSTPFSLTSVLF